VIRQARILLMQSHTPQPQRGTGLLSAHAVSVLEPCNSPSIPSPKIRSFAWQSTEDDADHRKLWLTHSLLLQSEAWQANRYSSTAVRLHRCPYRDALQTSVSIERQFSRIFPVLPSVTRFGAYPAPCGTASFCFPGSSQNKFVNRGKERRTNFFRVPPRKHSLALGSGAPRVASRKSVPRAIRANTNRRNNMALYENKITLKGYLGKDAENLATKQQKTFTVLSLATKSGYKDKQTEQWVNHTEWHRIVAFGKPADYAKGLKKGDYVEVEGELRSSEFDAEVGEGKKKTTVKRRGWEVRANIVKKLAQPATGGNPDADPITEDDAA
jgi:single-strand DNA-binding protein